MAAIVPRPCPLPSGLNSLLVFKSFTGVPPAPHGACTSWCLQAGAPEASWPRSAFPASYHQGEHKSRTPVTRFVDVRSEPPSHDGVSNLGYPRLFSWRGCRTSWSGTPFPKGTVEVVESEHDITIQAVETLSSRSLVISSLFQEHKQFAQERINRSHNSTCWDYLQETVHEVLLLRKPNKNHHRNLMIRWLWKLAPSGPQGH